MLVASVLANVRNQVALLFRDLGTDNVFAFHLTGDPYVTPSESEARRKPLEARVRARHRAARDRHPRRRRAGDRADDASNGQVLVARAGGNESDTVLVEGASPTLFDIIGAEFARGRPFTELEDREGRARGRRRRQPRAGAVRQRSRRSARPLTLAGDTYTVVGELAKRRGGFFGENRQDNVLNLPAGTVRTRFGEPERVVLYMQREARPARGLLRAGGSDSAAAAQAAAGRPRTTSRSRPPNRSSRRSTASARASGWSPSAWRRVSLLIGAIGIANVMFISVTERTREIGLRLAVGARRQEVLLQFLLEAAFLSGIGGIAGVAAALGIGLLLTLVVSGFSAVAPLWAIVAGLAASVGVGIVAGYWPARGPRGSIRSKRCGTNNTVGGFAPRRLFGR